MMDSSDGELDFFEVVVAGDTERTRRLGVVGLEGFVLGKSRAEDPVKPRASWRTTARGRAGAQSGQSTGAGTCNPVIEDSGGRVQEQR